MSARSAIEHAIENELDAFTTEQVREMRGYVAETVAWRLERDGFVSAGRIVEGDGWQGVRDALEALPEGAQIRWRTGVDEHPALAIKRRIFGDLKWATTDHNRHVNATNIARDNTPIEVIA